ncbi:MAG: MmgE/PrpD family protein [Candidatus Cloacimonetes bacterium]|nr:MmgE/PrpD family protein [Candidatus Cloacimonadota bacterium]
MKECDNHTFIDFMESMECLWGQDISIDSYHQAKRCLLDYLGVTIAGSYMLEDKIDKLLRHWQCDGCAAQVIGRKHRTDGVFAGLINGMSAHIAELDDGSNAGIVHPGSPVISALLSLLTEKRIGADKLLKAIILGYEATMMLALALQPSHKLKGYHATGTCGSIGATVACAFALGLPKMEARKAVSTSIVSASGMLKVLEGNSELKPYNVGKAAMNALVSLAMAEAGFESPDDPLGGVNGFMNMVGVSSNQYRWELPDIQRLKIHDVYTKPYAACRYCHPSIDAAIKIRPKISEYGFHDIDAINIETYDLAVKNHDHKDIRSVSSAKMSIPFSVGVAIATGRAGIGEFIDETINDSLVREIVSRCDVVPNSVMSQEFPRRSMAKITVLLKNKRAISDSIEMPLGEPENPLNDAQLEEKFYSLTDYAGLERRLAKKVASAVWDLNSRFEDFLEAIGTINIYDKE